MSVLIRLYPKAWRDRYADELSALLEDRPPGPSDALDLLLGAFDAHLHRRDLGIRSATGKATPMSSRIGAGAAMAGGALWILTLVVVTEDTAFGDLPMMLLSLTLLMFVVALAALSAVQFRSHPLLVWTCFLLPAVGVVLLASGLVAQVAFGDRPIAGDLTPYAFWISGVMLALAGSALFGIVSIVTGALTRMSAGLLSVGAVVQLVTIFGTDHSRDGWLMVLGTVAFGISWILVGVGVSRAERIRVADQAA